MPHARVKRQVLYAEAPVDRHVAPEAEVMRARALAGAALEQILAAQMHEAAVLLRAALSRVVLGTQTRVRVAHEAPHALERPVEREGHLHDDRLGERVPHRTALGLSALAHQPVATNVQVVALEAILARAMRALPVAAEAQEAEHVHRVRYSSTRVSGSEVEPVNVMEIAPSVRVVARRQLPQVLLELGKRGIRRQREVTAEFRPAAQSAAPN